MRNAITSTAFEPVPILMYHAVEDAPLSPVHKHLYVTAKEFAKQMKSLKSMGFTPIDFADLESTRMGYSSLPKKPIILTFDDGYANLEKNANPVLVEHNMKYTVFLVSGKIGGTNDWVESEGMTPTPLLTWNAIERIHADGVASFMPHTVTHLKLTQIPVEQARMELGNSKATLEDRLQRTMPTFCYPYGDCNDRIADLARDAGYTQAVTTQFGRVRLADESMLLPRVSVYHVPPVSITYGIGIMNFQWRVRSRRDTRP